MVEKRIVNLKYMTEIQLKIIVLFDLGECERNKFLFSPVFEWNYCKFVRLMQQLNNSLDKI